MYESEVRWKEQNYSIKIKIEKMKKRIDNPIIANANGKTIATGTTANNKKKFPDLGVYEWNNPVSGISKSGGTTNMAAINILTYYGKEIADEFTTLPTDIADYLMAYNLNDDKNYNILQACKNYFYARPYPYIIKKITEAGEKKDGWKRYPIYMSIPDVENKLGEVIATTKYKNKVNEVVDAVYKYQTDNYIPPLIQQSTSSEAEGANSFSSTNGKNKKDNDAGSGDPNSDKKSDNTTLLVVIGAVILVGIMMLKKSR